MSLGKKSVLLVLIILIIDQVLKIWIKTHMMLGQEITLFGNWGFIHFTENNGMAFGMEFGGNLGKLALSFFRIIAVGAIGWYLWYLIKNKANTGLVLSIAAIFAGALGNIIDSVFYGLIFNESYYNVATLFPDGGGYASLLQGKVVDMFYFPILDGQYPSWFPFWGGEQFLFFRPVFNVADSAITLGVLSILIFQRSFFKDEFKAKQDVA
jgi:signal peptidase II